MEEDAEAGARKEAKVEDAAEKKVASVETAVEETAEDSAVAMVMEKPALCPTRRREEPQARERPCALGKSTHKITDREDSSCRVTRPFVRRIGEVSPAARRRGGQHYSE